MKTRAVLFPLAFVIAVILVAGCTNSGTLAVNQPVIIPTATPVPSSGSPVSP